MQRDMETYVLDKLKKKPKIWNETTSPCSDGGAKSQCCIFKKILSKSGSSSYILVLITKISDGLYIWSIRKTHSGLQSRNVERERSAAGEIGMFPHILVDLFSPPDISRAERRKLEMICTYSVTLDHMVCSVPCC